MAVEMALTDGAAGWLREWLRQLEDNWHWSDDHHSTPTTIEDKLYLREIMRALDK